NLVQLGEGIVLVDLGVVVGIQELAGVVTAEAEGHLGQVVGAEAEELRFLGNLVGGEAGTGNLNHGAHVVGEVYAGGGDFGVGGLDHHALHISQLLDVAHQGNHDFGNHLPLGMSLFHIQGSPDDGLGLHGGDFRVGNCQTAATVTHHGVGLVEGSNHVLDLLHGLTLSGSQ